MKRIRLRVREIGRDLRARFGSSVQTLVIEEVEGSAEIRREIAPVADRDSSTVITIGAYPTSYDVELEVESIE